MIRKWFVLLAVLVCLAVLASCSQEENNTAVITDNTNIIFAPNTDYDTSSDTTGINNNTTSVESPEIKFDAQSSLAASEIEPPLSEADLAMAVPDFLTEEQQLLYRRARSVFPAFSGYPFQIDEYPPDGYEGDYRALLGEMIETKDEIGPLYYYAATGRYKRWDDFISMGTSIFTQDYFAWLSDSFLNINGYTYIPDTAKGGHWGYLPILSPDTFNLISKTDTEIRFEVVGHYFDTWNIDTANPDSVTTESFPITMVLTSDGWRFSEFNSPA